MSTFKDLPKLPKKDEEFFKNFLKVNEKNFSIILPLKFEVKESRWRKLDGFSLIKKKTLIGEYFYSIFYQLDAGNQKGYFYFYYEG